MQLGNTHDTNMAESNGQQNDEDGVQQDNQDTSLSRRQPGEPRPSTSDMPSTSGNPPLQSRPTPAPMLQHHRTPAQQQARRDRELYWSLLNAPRRSTLFSVQRPMHTPAPDLIERPNEVSPNADIQRILAIKRFARGCTLRARMKPNNSTFYAVPANRSNQGPSMVPYPMIPPSTSQSSGNMFPRSSRCVGFRRNRPLIGNQIPRVNGDGAPPIGEAGPSSSGMAPADIIQSSAMGEAPLNENISTENSVDISNSDEDIEMPCPSTSAAGASNDNNAEQDPGVNGEGVAQNISDVGMSLEEEIVEIDPQEISNANEVPDIDVEAISNNDEETKEVLSILRDMQERQDGVADASQAHGVKRKREGSADINTPYSVKEFNQSLLRLLECPVCLEWMEPPISQCRRGHLVCSRCRARLASCPVCRTMFSSVRNRAMEGVAEMLRYPCRHGCGREVRLRRRAPHEASCAARKYHCPAPVCAHRHPLPREQLANHFQSKHLSMLKIGALHKFTMKVNTEHHDNWLIMTLNELFHLRVDIDIRTWGVVVYVAYIGPKCNASNFVYEVTVDGHQNARKLVYTRLTHSDLESSTMSMGRQDCFHLTLDQAVNFLRFTSRNSEADKYLDFNVEVKKCVQPVNTKDDVDS